MPGKATGYIRVSTIDQNPDRQLEGVTVDKKFIDYASGTNTNRPQLAALLDYIREEDIVYVHSIDRLARNLKDLLKLVDVFISKKVELHFLKEKLTFNGTDCKMSTFLLDIFGAVAEFEHRLLMERQREGIERAKKLGRYVGRKKHLKPEQMDWLKVEMQTRRPRKDIAAELGISRHTLYKYMARI